MSKKNLLHLLAIMMVAMLSVGFVSCGDDDDDDYVPQGGQTTTTPETPSADPEGTIIANLRCGIGSLRFSGMPFDVSLILSSAYNFDCYNNNVYDNSVHMVDEHYCKSFADIVSIGSVKGLSSITKVPEKGWTNITAAIPGYGYVVRYKYGGYFSSLNEAYRADVDALPIVAYVRLYVTDYITNNSDGGCTIKYQVWKP